MEFDTTETSVDHRPSFIARVANFGKGLMVMVFAGYSVNKETPEFVQQVTQGNITNEDQRSKIQ